MWSNGKLSVFKGKKNIAHPEMELLKERAANPLQSTFDPVYPSTEKLDSRGLDSKGRRQILKNILSKLSEGRYRRKHSPISTG